MKTRPGRHVAILRILICLLYVGYRIYESQTTAALLRQETLEAAVPTVAVISAKPSEPNETITRNRI